MESCVSVDAFKLRPHDTGRRLVSRTSRSPCLKHDDHHFICPIIQHYAHLHKYNSRRAGQQDPIKTLTAALKRSIKTVTGCTIIHDVVARVHLRRLILLLSGNLSVSRSCSWREGLSRNPIPILGSGALLSPPSSRNIVSSDERL